LYGYFTVVIPCSLAFLAASLAQDIFMYNGLDRLAVNGIFPLCQLLQFRLANPFTGLFIVFVCEFQTVMPNLGRNAITFK
jgi:hypothetical protein